MIIAITLAWHLSASPAFISPLPAYNNMAESTPQFYNMYVVCVEFAMSFLWKVR